LAGETEALGENLPQCRFVHHKPHMLCSDANPGRRGGKPATNSLIYGTAHYLQLILCSYIHSRSVVCLCCAVYTTVGCCASQFVAYCLGIRVRERVLGREGNGATVVEGTGMGWGLRVFELPLLRCQTLNYMYLSVLPSFATLA
jgi:hypothetical protein